VNSNSFAYIRLSAAWLVFVACVMLIPAPSWGQATTGQILGQVTDSSGAAVPGASITATDQDKNVTFTGVTNSTGNYTVLSMPPGPYSVTAVAPGFGEAKVNHATLVIDQHLLLNFQLKVGNVSSSVEVTDAPPVLQTQSAEVGTVIGGDTIVDLPLEGRNFYALTTLVPGVAVVGGSINSFALSVSGQREFANSIQLDGVESTTNRTQDVTVQPNVDSVEEFKVVTASYNAEFGNAAGGVIAVQTKAGTNHFHGDAFEFYRPNFLTAKQTLPGVDTPQPSPALKQHNFGGTLGGPIKRDRAFLFGAYEGVRLKNAYSYVYSTVPFGLINITPIGDVDFSGLVDPFSGNPGGPPAGTVDPIFDPDVTVENCYYFYCPVSQQFSGNVIPASRVSKAGLNTLLNFYPKPNLTGIDNGWFRNYDVSSPVNDNTDHVDSRFDQVITSKDRLYAVYHWQAENSLVTDPFHGHTVVPGAGDADQANKQDDGAQSISITYDHIISPTALNEFRFGYLNYYLDQYSLLNGTDYSTKYGLGNVAVSGFSATVGYPDIYLGDGYLAGGSTYKPYHVKDQNYQFTDSFSWSGVKRHELKFGGDLRLLNSHPNFSLFPTGFDYFDSFGFAQTSDYGAYYGNGGTFINGAYNYTGGSDLADLVLGLPQTVDIGLQLTNPHTKSWNLDFYAQDSFKATPQLTLNYGLRYEFQDPWTEANNYMSNYDLVSGNILLAGRAGASDSLVESRKNDLSPRFGFAYIINPKTVFRAGAAIFFTPENDGREDFLTKNLPFANQAAYSNYPPNGPAAPLPASPWEYQMDTGVPRSTTIDIPSSGIIIPSTLTDGNLVTTYAVKPSIKTGTTGSYNFSLQRQLTRTTSLDVALVGSLSRHLSYQVGDINANPADNQDDLLTTSLGKIQYLTDAGNSSYTSLQVKVTRQASRNLSFLASYTYGHDLDNGPAPFNLGHINNNSPQDPNNLSREWASADSDLRHNFVFSGSYNLPFGQGQPIGSHWGTVANAIFGGWRFSPIFRMQSGTPVNVVRGTNPNSVLPGLRPDVTGDPTIPHDKRNYLQWFNTAAFSVPPALQTSALPGSAGRNIVVGPAYVNLDSSLAKDFSIENKWKLQVRAEAFNTSNTVHLSNPDGNFNSGTFGQISSVLPSSNRVAQLAAKFIF
jgi:Carboxypeptidase regulatory-like domain